MSPAEVSFEGLRDTPEGQRLLWAAAILVVMLGLEILLLARIVRKVRARPTVPAPDVPWTFADMRVITGALLPLMALPLLSLMQRATAWLQESSGLAGMWSDPAVLRLLLGTTAVMEAAAAGLVLYRAFRRHGLPWSELGFWFPGVKEGLVRPLFWIGGFLLAEGLYEKTLTAFGLPPGPQLLGALIGSAESGGDLALVFAVAGFLIPVLEEFLFRGFLFQLFRRYTGTAWGLGIATFLFAVGHIEPGQTAGAWVPLCLRLPEFFGLGFLLGWLAWRSGSLAPSITAHVVNNLVGVALLLRR